VTLPATWELFQVHDALVDMTVAVTPGWPTPGAATIRFQDICYRNQLDACAFSGCEGWTAVAWPCIRAMPAAGWPMSCACWRLASLHFMLTGHNLRGPQRTLGAAC
jgi:hypothetical protein